MLPTVGADDGCDEEAVEDDVGADVAGDVLTGASDAGSTIAVVSGSRGESCEETPATGASGADSGLTPE